MSNYYKNSTVLRISEICRNITTNDITDNYYRNLGIPLGSTTFTSSINENPANLGYKYNNIDISTYCIATYIESSVTTFSSVPSWCNKIRAILVGGGGTGGTGSIGTTQDTKIQNDGKFYVKFRHYNQSAHTGYEQSIQYFIFENTKYTDITTNAVNVLNNTNTGNIVWNNTTNKYYQLYNTADFDDIQYVVQNQNDQYVGWDTYDHETTNEYISISSKMENENYVQSVQVLGTGGAGGGGGGFLYLETALNATNRNQITLNSVGASTHTSITISGTTYTALKGGAATSNTTVGSGGTVTGTVNISASGNAGVTTTTSTGGSGGLSGLSNYSTVLPTYGRGGDGGDAVVKGQTAAPGDSGTTGYYRIYYLTD